MKPRLIGTMLSQGFRAAWSDADVVWLRNPFTMFDKSADLVLAWADNSHVTGGVILPPGTFPGGAPSAARPHSAFLAIIPDYMAIFMLMSLLSFDCGILAQFPWHAIFTKFGSWLDCTWICSNVPPRLSVYID